MSNFNEAYYKYILPNEGGYANMSYDKGGETYAGIARNYHSYWTGWSYIDSLTKPIKTNSKFSQLDNQVKEFYLALWNKNLIGSINSQPVANLLFDYIVHSSSHAIKAIQRIVGVKDDGVMGILTLKAINNANENFVYKKLLEERESWFNYLVQKDPTQSKFLSGWLYRLQKFVTDFPIGGNTVSIFIFLILITLLILI